MMICQKRKQKIPHSYIATEKVLIAEEGQNCAKRAQTATEAISSRVIAQPSSRRPPRCSMCGSLEHNARVCLRHIA